MPRLVIKETPDVDVEELKASIDLRTLVTPSAAIRNGKPTKTLCFWHDDHDPSLYVYEDHVHCFACGEHMDLLDFVAWQEGLDTSRDFDRLVETISDRYASRSRQAPREEARPPSPITQETALYFHERLGDRRRWFRDRGLSDETIDRELLGYDRQAFTIPVWGADGNLQTVRFRRDDEYDTGTGPKYWGMPGRNNALLYNLKALELTSLWAFVVVCEGELDALKLYQEGLPAISTTNGASAFDEGMTEEVLKTDVPRVIVAYDQDQAGLVNGARVARLFRLRGRVAVWPESLGKDVTEVLKTWTVERLVSQLMCARRPVSRFVSRVGSGRS